METEEKQSLRESIYEVMVITKTCLTTIWFWVPTIFAIYIYFQLYLMTINPLLLLVGPAIMIAYALLWEDRRFKAQYGKDIKVLRSSDPLFATPRKATGNVEIEQLVEEYEKLVKNRPEKSDNAANDSGE